MSVELLLFALVIIAGLYMAWNIGANDVANAMGTSVGSGALTLKRAVILAAILEFSGAFFFGTHVTETLQAGIVDSSIFQRDPIILVYGMLSALLAAGVWIQLASYKGWPVATTHCIVGSIVGFGAIVGGWEAVYWNNVRSIATSWILSPVIAGILSFSIFNFLRRKIFFSPDPVEATKRITPPLVFIVLTTLSLVMVYNGLKNLDMDLNFVQSLGASVFLGGIGSLISYVCLRGSLKDLFRGLPWMKMNQYEPLVATGVGAENALEVGSLEYHKNPLSRTTFSKGWVKPQEEYHPEISSQLDKAKKHLQHVQLLSRGAAHYQVSELLDEVENLSQSLRKTEESGKVSAEYAMVEKIFGYLQIITACFMAFAHGANDVANAIGPLTAAIGVLTTGTIALQTTVPTWALGIGGLGIVVGLATWGWRVIETIGKKITELTPTRGFAAEFGAAATILIASRFGLPISTTHTLVGSVIGVGMARGIEALDLGTMRPIVLSWLMTVPAGAGITIVFFYIIQAIFG